MKPEHLLQELKDLAEKLNIKVSEQNFRNAGIKVKSGFCKIKDEENIIIDKHKSSREKNEILALYLNRKSIEDIYIVPAVREFLDRAKGKDSAKLFSTDALSTDDLPTDTDTESAGEDAG